MRWWWPRAIAPYFWPPELPRVETLDNFRAAFELKGYELCENGDLEDGYEKVAIYADDQTPTHAARQLPSGAWTSKLGKLQDIEHATVGGVEGEGYGRVAFYMRRRRTPGVSSSASERRPSPWPF